MSASTSRRDLWLIFGLALLVRGLAALPQTQPNYMDAAYYLAGGQRLTQGAGFTDPYVWNYLDQPASLPHPSHLYWMPLPSIMVALSQTIFGVNYRAAQLPFVLFAAVLPVLAYVIARRVSAVRRHAWLAALLTIFSPFYLPYWGVPESFAPFAVCGALALYWASAEAKWKWLMAGVCAGLAHLSRADGVLLLMPLLLAQIRLHDVSGRRKIFIPHPSSLILIPIGYLLVMLPWFWRNISVIGAPLSTAGSQAMWLCTYDELFAYGQTFDLAHWLSCGNLIGSRLNGVGAGALHWLGEAGMIFLAPLIVVGLWRARRARVLHAALWYALLLFVAMTLVFTFAGDRGGLFHSTGALLPFFYAAAPIGLDAAIDWIAQRRRTWRADRAKQIFSSACVLSAVLLSFAVYRGRVIGPDWNAPIWNQAGEVDRAIGRWLAERGAVDPIVLVNNPPSFTYQTGLRSIVIPYGSVDDLLKAARQFGAQWLVVDDNRPELLAEIFAIPGALSPPMVLRATFDGSRVFEIVTDND
jgi:4-amino-4-deoxy-L-arabinose transferase-like glycosyltransferase